MLFSISGPQNTGKTSCIDALKEHSTTHNRWWCFPKTDYRRLIKEQNLPLNQGATFESQKTIMQSLLTQELYFFEQKDVDGKMIGFSRKEHVIFDRSSFDCLIYSFYAYMSDRMTCSEWEQLNRMYRHQSHRYRRMLTLYNDRIPLEPRDGRDVGIDYLKKIDVLFRMFDEMETGDLRAFRIDSPNLQQKQRFFIDILESFT